MSRTLALMIRCSSRVSSLIRPSPTPAARSSARSLPLRPALVEKSAYQPSYECKQSPRCEDQSGYGSETRRNHHAERPTPVASPPQAPAKEEAAGAGAGILRLGGRSGSGGSSHSRGITTVPDDADLRTAAAGLVVWRRNGERWQADHSKMHQLLKDAVSPITRVVFLYDPASLSGAALGPTLKLMQSAAPAQNVVLQPVAVSDPNGVPEAFGEFERGTNGLVIQTTTVLLMTADQICKLALQRQLPAAGHGRDFANSGCLMSYGKSGRHVS